MNPYPNIGSIPLKTHHLIAMKIVINVERGVVKMDRKFSMDIPAQLIEREAEIRLARANLLEELDMIDKYLAIIDNRKKQFQN